MRRDVKREKVKAWHRYEQRVSLNAAQRHWDVHGFTKFDGFLEILKSFPL